MYSTHNEGTSVVTVRFIRIWKDKIYKNMTANESKSYLGYLNKFIDEYNIIMLAKYVFMGIVLPKFKVGDRVRMMKYRNIFGENHTGKWSKEIFVIDSVLKTNT